MKTLEELVDELALGDEMGRVGHLFTTPRDIIVPRYSEFPVININVGDIDIGVLHREPYFEYKFIPHAGKGFTLERALKSALGEAIERTLPTISLPRLDYFGRYKELQDSALGPREIHLFAKEQYDKVPFRPFTDDSVVGWVRLEGGERPYAPAQVITLGYRLRPGEHLIAYASSDGHSPGVGLWALYRGALEFIERDAINLGWHSDVPPLRVRLSLDEALRLVGVRPRSLDLKLHVFLWRTDVEGVFVVSAHLLANRPVYAYMPGCGAGFSFEEALAKALAEAGQAYGNVYNIARMRREFGRDHPLYYVDKDAPTEEADNLFRVVWYWGYEENLRRLYDMFFSRAKEVDPPRSAPPERISHRLSLLPPFYWYEYKGAEPLRLVKVFFPQLTQYNAPRYPMFGHPRYYQARRILGVCDCELTYQDLRKIPVPYP